MYKDKIKECTLLFKKIISDFKNELNKEKEKKRGRVAKGFFGLTFDGVRDNKDGTKKKTSFSREKKKAIIIHQKYIIYKKPTYKNLKACYYAFFKIAFKKGVPSTCT